MIYEQMNPKCQYKGINVPVGKRVYTCVRLVGPNDQALPRSTHQYTPTIYLEGDKKGMVWRVDAFTGYQTHQEDSSTGTIETL